MARSGTITTLTDKMTLAQLRQAVGQVDTCSYREGVLKVLVVRLAFEVDVF